MRPDLVPEKIPLRVAAILEGVDLTGADEDDYEHIAAKWQSAWDQIRAVLLNL